MSQAVVKKSCAKFRSAIGDEAVARSKFADDLRDMLEALEAIQPFLEDAKIPPQRVGPQSEKLWDARAAYYNIMDIVDELQDTRSSAAVTAKMMLPCLAIMKNDIAGKVEETKKQVMRMHEWHSRFNSMEVVDTISRQIIEERKTGPTLKEAMVLGRESDKKRIMGIVLLSSECNITQKPITILLIFGLAGSGKTTLAQMVFNDTHDLQGYDFRVWVHVSTELKFHTIGESILRHVSVAGGGQEDDNHVSLDVEGMECIMKCLIDLLNGKKVLLVLDDLWEEDPIQLQLLKSMLTFLGHKVDVIVTTCNQAIARMICTVEPYRLNALSDDTCWEIIQRSIHFQKDDKGKSCRS